MNKMKSIIILFIYIYTNYSISCAENLYFKSNNPNNNNYINELLKNSKGIYNHCICLEDIGENAYNIPNTAIPDTIDIKIYKKISNNFEFDKNIMLKITVPASWEDILYSRGFRFFIVKIEGDYANIVYDIENNLNGWIKLNDSYSEVIMFNDLSNSLSYIDPFIEGNKVKLYSSPEEKTYYKLLYQNQIKGGLRVVEQKNNFIKVVDEYLPDEEEEIKNSHDTFIRKKIGWLKIRDEKKKIKIWFKDIAWF